MKKQILASVVSVMLVVMMMPTVMAGEVFNGGSGEGDAGEECDIPEVVDFLEEFHYDGGSTNGRDPDWPEYEYAFQGDTVHFKAKVSDSTTYNLENEIVKVYLYCPGETFDVTLSLVSGTGATYDPATGRYWGWFEEDWVVPSAGEVSGNCVLEVFVENPCGNTDTDDLSDPLYENVNDVLANPYLDWDFSGSFSFDLVPNQWNDNTDYPVYLTLNTPDDREGQGLLGDLDLATTDFVGTVHGEVLPASDIRFKEGSGLTWTMLEQNDNGITPPLFWTDLEDPVFTDGIAGYEAQLYFEIWYDATHSDLTYTNDGIWFEYAIY